MNADRLDIPASLAIPVGAAFLVQVSACLVPWLPEVRALVEARLSPVALATALVAGSVVPYLIYSVPTGVFSLTSLLILVAFSGTVSFVYVVAPAHGRRFLWQDGLVLALLAYPMISGLSDMFAVIYRSPGGNIPEDVDALGKVMVVALAPMVLLSLRRVPETNYQLAISSADLVVGVKNFLLFLPVGVPLAVGIGFATWEPQVLDSWTVLLEMAGRAVSLYAMVALSEELFFRGVIQNLLTGSLGRPWLAQVLAAGLFGLVHITRGFPNWRYVLVAGVSGWFYGRAYTQSQSVVAAAVTHVLVGVTHAFVLPRI